MIRVLVAGAAGRMGREVVRAVSAADGMEVVSAVDPGAEGTSIETGADGATIVCSAELTDAIEESHPDVMVDFTHPSVVEGNLRIALARDVDCVVGTTGLTESKLVEIAQTAGPRTTLFFAPNFAIGAVLMMDFAARAAKFLPHAEIIELHHDQKADAPSGTALRTAELIAAARAEAPVDARSRDGVAGPRRGSRCGCERRARALGAASRARRAPGGALRRPGPDALAATRHDRPELLHARCACSPSERSDRGRDSSSGSTS